MQLTEKQLAESFGDIWVIQIKHNRRNQSFRRYREYYNDFEEADLRCIDLNNEDDFFSTEPQLIKLASVLEVFFGVRDIKDFLCDDED
jgi:hypothetical protein